MIETPSSTHSIQLASKILHMTMIENDNDQPYMNNFGTLVEPGIVQSLRRFSELSPEDGDRFEVLNLTGSIIGQISPRELVSMIGLYISVYGNDIRWLEGAYIAYGSPINPADRISIEEFLDLSPDGQLMFRLIHDPVGLANRMSKELRLSEDNIPFLIGRTVEKAIDSRREFVGLSWGTQTNFELLLKRIGKANYPLDQTKWGIVAGEIQSQPWFNRTAHVFYVDEILVHPKYQSQGLSRSLISGLVKVITSQSYDNFGHPKPIKLFFRTTTGGVIDKLAKGKLNGILGLLPFVPNSDYAQIVYYHAEIEPDTISLILNSGVLG